jgi:hypothetical protein
MSTIQELELKVLALPVEQRVLLAESLLGSLPPVVSDMSEAEELAEAERRDREIESGSVQALNAADFWRRVEGSRQR